MSTDTRERQMYCDVCDIEIVVRKVGDVYNVQPPFSEMYEVDKHGGCLVFGRFTAATVEKRFIQTAPAPTPHIAMPASSPPPASTAPLAPAPVYKRDYSALSARFRGLEID